MNDVGSVILWVSLEFVVMTFIKLSKETTKLPPSTHENNDINIYEVITDTFMFCGSIPLCGYIGLWTVNTTQYY
jgi:hypothetical protein